MPIEMDEISAMRACVVAVLETLDLGIDVRMFGEDRAVPADRPYGEFWLIGGSGFVVDEDAPRPTVRRVGLLQLTIWQPLGMKESARKLVLRFNRGFAGRSMCDPLHRSYEFKKKAEVTQITRGKHVATVGRIGFSRDEPAESACDLRSTW